MVLPQMAPLKRDTLAASASDFSVNVIYNNYYTVCTEVRSVVMLPSGFVAKGCGSGFSCISVG
jgi:hypothetical protein